MATKTGNAKKLTITVQVAVEVDVDAYATAYGITDSEVWADAVDHVPGVVSAAAREATERLGYITDARHVGHTVSVSEFR